MTQLTDCVVVGAGPAGLAASATLVARGVDHVVLERGRAGETWRTQRWNSLRLNNPGWMNPMLQHRDTYLTAAEVVTRLERLASLAPVREHTPVIAVLSHGDAWTIRTTDVEFNTRAIVLATGGENVPLIPRLARLVPDRIAQFHAASYRAPDQLPDGAVLVVGSAQSGYQISEELLRAVGACTWGPVLWAEHRPGTAVGTLWNGSWSAGSSISGQTTLSIGPSSVHHSHCSHQEDAARACKLWPDRAPHC
jgi:putative flavoprotein involved in K+ transport